MKNSVSNLALKALSKIAMNSATKSVNSTCDLLTFQPKVPETAKKLRKF